MRELFDFNLQNPGIEWELLLIKILILSFSCVLREGPRAGTLEFGNCIGSGKCSSIEPELKDKNIKLHFWMIDIITRSMNYLSWCFYLYIFFNSHKAFWAGILFSLLKILIAHCFKNILILIEPEPKIGCIAIFGQIWDKYQLSGDIFKLEGYFIFGI